MVWRERRGKNEKLEQKSTHNPLLFPFLPPLQRAGDKKSFDFDNKRITVNKDMPDNQIISE